MPINRTPPPLPNKDGTEEETNTDPQHVSVRAAKRPAPGSPDLNTVAASDSDSDGPVTTGQVRDIVQEVIGKEINAFMQNFHDTLRDVLNTELKPIKDDVQELTKTVDHLRNQYDNIIKEQQSTKESLKVLEAENHTLTATVDDLKKRINLMEQHARSNNAEIQCVPEKKNENLLTIITKLCEVINCPTAGQNISHCTRIAKFDPKSNRPRSIIVQFSNVRFRDEFLAAVFKFNKHKKIEDKINATHLNLSDSKEPIFVNEHLSPANKDLFAAARQVRKAKKYQFLWIRNGKIFMRKDDTSNFVLIKDKCTLDKLE